MRSIIRKLGNPKIFVFTIMWMMILVFVGTIAQRDMGLYYAQQKYFSNWLAWFGPIPVPGGRLTMLVMFLNMTSLLFRQTLWKIKKIGIIIVHLGALLLLIGGGITAWFSFEGNMVLDEGGQSNFIVNSQQSELAFINTTQLDYDDVFSLPEKILTNGNVLNPPDLPFSIEVIQFHPNAEAVRRTQPKGDYYHGLAKNFLLMPKENEKESEMNRSGVLFKISDTNSDADGIYSLFLGQSIPQTLQVKDESFTLVLRRERIYLPFAIELLDFKRVLHPGTTIPKSFSSQVNLIENNIPRRVMIKMNEPLRHESYTFFQASFSQSESGETSILAVVKNYGRLFPYISSLIMSFGLLIHLLMQMPKLLTSKGAKKA
ncbi:MAG: cytochrome c biogenesis protein ResB [Candidatus Marinimicrobia bacterium]|nr:cytochrome c biogenesis protein ResB [Candidatus Neomarinimicrobiota bacterium]